MGLVDRIFAGLLEETRSLVEEKGISDPPCPKTTKVLAERVEAAFRARWQLLVSRDSTLIAAHAELAEADSERYPEIRDTSEQIECLQRELSKPLGVLMDAGENAVPHLALHLMAPTNASRYLPYGT